MTALQATSGANDKASAREGRLNAPPKALQGRPRVCERGRETKT